MTTESTGRKPDFNVFVKSGTGENAPLLKVGAVWKHGTGDGFNIKLSSLPIDGQLVAFPPKEDDKA